MRMLLSMVGAACLSGCFYTVHVLDSASAEYNDPRRELSHVVEMGDVAVHLPDAYACAGRAYMVVAVRNNGWRAYSLQPDEIYLEMQGERSYNYVPAGAATDGLHGEAELLRARELPPDAMVRGALLFPHCIEQVESATLHGFPEPIRFRREKRLAWSMPAMLLLSGAIVAAAALVPILVVGSAAD